MTRESGRERTDTRFTENLDDFMRESFPLLAKGNAGDYAVKLQIEFLVQTSDQGIITADEITLCVNVSRAYEDIARRGGNKGRIKTWTHTKFEGAFFYENKLQVEQAILDISEAYEVQCREKLDIDMLRGLIYSTLYTQSPVLQ
jgi:hypothetical protein